MNLAEFVARLDGVIRTGPDRYRAVCPAHPSKSRSKTLALTEGEGGRIVMHCFAGCSVNEIAQAVEVDLAELFPPKPVNHSPPIRNPIPAADVLACLHEPLMNAFFLYSEGRKRPLDAREHAALVYSTGLIYAAAEAANGK